MVGRNGLGIWDGNAIKLGCDDDDTMINIIKLSLKKKKIQVREECRQNDYFYLKFKIRKIM